MTLPPAFLDELRARTTLSALIGKAVKLQRAGREWKACCPFHQEKTPSFTISDEKGFYHCFGCGAHGDAISWLTDARGLAFMDAVKELADAAGMAVPAADPRARAKAEKAAGLHEVVEAAARWFTEQLDGIEGAEARDYLKQRGIGEAIRRKFGLGFAPDASGKLRNALKSHGIERLVEAGLLVAPEDGDREPFDRFRRRLMIPIRDPRGRAIGFGGRFLGQAEGVAKYLNSPETPLFDKGRTLYNLDRAAPAAREAKRIIVVEGYFDVIGLDSAGIAEAVAPLGTALTEGQLDLLWRISRCPILCFDGDAAGQKAAVRAALRALPRLAPDRSLAFVTLPAGQDPDDLVHAGGRAAFETLLQQPEPLAERLWRYELETEPLDTPERRAGLKRRLMDHSAVIADRDVRDEYRRDWLRRYDALNAPPRSAGQRQTSPGAFHRGRFQPGARFQPFRQPASAEAKAVGRSGLDPQLVKAVLRGLALFPEEIGRHVEEIQGLAIASGPARRLRDGMIDAAMEGGELDRESLRTILAAKGIAGLLDELDLSRGLAFSFTRREAEAERARRDLVLLIETLAARPSLEAAIAAATARLEEAGDQTAFLEQLRLLAARQEADRKLALLMDGETD